ncbi:glucuronate isomerase [Robertkochia solimangrovi]|uniref:glucuronate isomerase n=1 Tax=Robertkochia solimangrovi TaxID=2213046 RepID=UPI00117E8715|nr:glucuronate isomerase [Robertkochia solimangrovi]TRZ46200.1 glucuronate isomerase [Robertkochia solimangrovi]
MKNNPSFIHDNFLLENTYAQQLYHDYASAMPIIDYHCHLSPKSIAEDEVFKNLTHVWIYGDHYKWRAMRALGVNEKFITGDATDAEKFQKWGESVPYTMRNPLYHWTHLELARYFGITDLLNADSAPAIYEKASGLLNTSEYSCRNLLRKMNVEVVCTTEDPIDTLEYHQQLEGSGLEIHVSTAFRPDKAILIHSEGYNDYLNQLEKASGKSINTYKDLLDALESRIAYFHDNGCKLSDHGLDYLPFSKGSEKELVDIFAKRRKGGALTMEESHKFQTGILLFLSEQYHKLGWVQQFHLGALRNNNRRMLSKLGPDTGWDSIGDFAQASNLSAFLNELDGKDTLTKTILYNLNPADNEVMATMIGNFNDGSVRGKVQFGSGWWFLDQKQGIIEQLNALSNMGVVSTFIGMLTDSRSFLSYPRHEYFRRVLCNLFGKEIASGELPEDLPWIGKIIQDICYNNARNYFNYPTIKK